jgi:hypothetical protein
MKVCRRALFLSLLPALCLLGLPAVVTAAPSPTPALRPGDYIGTVTMTTMHSGSTSIAGNSTNWSIDMVGSIGNIDVFIGAAGTWIVSVDMPVPIAHHNTAQISDKASKCKGFTVTSSGYGTATGKGGSLAPHTVTGAFTINGMDFALSSMSASIKKNGQCPSDTWGPEARVAIDSDFAAIFGSQWTFTASSATAASLAGPCQSATFGKAKGEMLHCDWRAYWIPSK